MLDPNINPDLTLRILDSPFVIKNYVKGENRCNYELYLTELLNKSRWVMEQYPKEFIRQEEQSRGECDAYSGEYGIDYKLIASKTRLMAQNILCSSIYRLPDDSIVWVADKKENTVKVTRLQAALRKLDLDKLIFIRRRKVKKYGILNDIITFLLTLEKQKNLLLFFPYRFAFDNVKKYEKGIEIVVDALQYDFGYALAYRNLKAPEYDTLFTTIYNEQFLLLNVVNNKLELVDVIDLEKCATFEHLKQYSDIWR